MLDEIGSRETGWVHRADECSNFLYFPSEGLLTVGRLQHGDNPEHSLVITPESHDVTVWHQALIARIGFVECRRINA